MYSDYEDLDIDYYKPPEGLTSEFEALEDGLIAEMRRLEASDRVKWWVDELRTWVEENKNAQPEERKGRGDITQTRETAKFK